MSKRKKKGYEPLSFDPEREDALSRSRFTPRGRFFFGNYAHSVRRRLWLRWIAIERVELREAIECVRELLADFDVARDGWHIESPLLPLPPLSPWLVLRRRHFEVFQVPPRGIRPGSKP